MNKTRVKTTGTLLIMVFIVSMFTVVSSVGAYADIIRVPEDYPTIQEAIDAASGGDTILVGPGEWFGGIVDKPVRIVGMRGAVIVDGVPYPGPPPPGITPSPEELVHFGFFITPKVVGQPSATSRSDVSSSGIQEPTLGYQYLPGWQIMLSSHITKSTWEIFLALSVLQTGMVTTG